ncbi:hypothetical protein [Streptomyces sp. NPDC001388]|uniref:hypothetical protein n=1 Tax=Streptomyces sp. NPDC001388 TaxID=3364568 RepID=UPI0036843CC5
MNILFLMTPASFRQITSKSPAFWKHGSHGGPAILACSVSAGEIQRGVHAGVAPHDGGTLVLKMVEVLRCRTRRRHVIRKAVAAPTLQRLTGREVEALPVVEDEVARHPTRLVEVVDRLDQQSEIIR